ncbi:PREDICTED: uncharacterized protein LOC105568228 [Vollenhovia emeryi]|uniref:uncharacterized protein LOC105568228 n=1 Tax=Vollenhovia emeryi TaxID=411798 RepID=UPI0005F4D663|nr:PREDICTED: uncharacterized protein LOC105568228 [Vollenhovia emeryi]
MWFPVTLLLLVGVAVASPDHEHGWQTNNKYQYRVETQTLAGVSLNRPTGQYTGLHIQGILEIDVKSPETLKASLLDFEYAHIRKILLDNPEIQIAKGMLTHRLLRTSGKQFEIKIKHGLIRDLLVDPDVPTWEVNIIKSIVSQLQLDTQGENANNRKSTQFPINRNSSVAYECVEDSVNGMCTVLYAIEPLVENYHVFSPDRVPKPHLRGTGRYYKVEKVKTNDRCSRRQAYHYDFNDPLLQRNPGRQSELIDHLSMSQAIISGDLKCFTIQSTMMKSTITITNKRGDPALGTVHSILRLHLTKKEKLPESTVEIFETNTRKNKLQSTGNLLYVYNNPFSETENRKERRPTISKNSAQAESMEMENLSSESELYSWSSSEELSYEKSQTALHLPPNAPLLPFFVGNKGKSIVMFDKFDAVKEAQDLISQITNELRTPSQKLSQEMLEKFTILKNLLRTMNRKQYEELENAVLTNGEHSEDHLRKRDAWPVLRDAVAHAATGPALLTIENWLKRRQLEGIEAARVVSQIPKTVREPSEKYVRAFYEMIQDPVISQQNLLNTTALLTFAKLLRNSQTTYSIRGDSSMTQKNNNDIVNRYIPYLADQLKQAYREDNLQKIQTCIMALGMTEHPKIIPVLEPYLENTKPATKYQRLLMVASLGTLARTQPKLVGTIFYKLYAGKEENHEIRCLAVQHYILTNPPQIMLKHIAHSTHEEENYHVNSVIKTTLESLADSKISALGDLHDKARAVTSFLSPVKSKYGSSGGLYIDFANSIIQGLSLQTVVGDDSEIPMYARVRTLYDFFKNGRPTLEAAYGVSSVRQLLNNIDKLWQKESGKVNEKFMRKTRAEEIAETLKIKPENLDKLEGSLFLNTLFGFIYYPFDSNTVQQVIVMWKNMLKKDHGMHSTAFYNYERTVTFPIETGLPFVFSLEMPTLVKLHVKSKKVESCNGCRNGVLKVVLGRKVQKRFGFIAPFAHTHYMAGTDDNRMLQIPLEYEVKLDMTRQNLELKVRPNIPKDQMDSQLSLLHYSTVPFTSQHDIFNLQPLCLDNNMDKVLTIGQQKNKIEKGKLTIWIESDSVEKKDIHLEEELQNMWEQDDGRYKKLDVLLNTEEGRKSEVRLNIAYDNMEIRDNKDDSEQPQELDLQGIPEPSWKPNSEDRKLQIMKTLQKGFKSGEVHVVDITYNTPQKQQVLTFSLAQSNVDQKSRIYVYWNTQTPKENQNEYEVCYVQELQSSPSTPLDFEYTLRNTPTDKFWAEMLFGRNCQGGEKLRIEGHATRSNKLKAVIESSKLTEQCREEIRRGDNVGRACQMAIEIAEVRDLYQVSLKTANEHLRRLVHQSVEIISLVLRKLDIRTDFMSHPDSNPIKVKLVKVPHDTETFMESLMPLNVQSPPMPIMGPFWKPTERSLSDSDVWEFLGEPENDVCTLYNNMVVTFDKRTYSVKTENVRHALMAPFWYPEIRSELMDGFPEGMRVSVVAADMADGSKFLVIHLNNQEIEMQTMNNRIEFSVNSLPIYLSKDWLKNKWYRNSEDGRTVFEIIELPDGSIKVTSDKYGLEVVYKVQYVQLKASDKYRNAIRGLCGNYDSDSSNDFLTPQNCLLAKAEEFTAMYALLDKDSEGPVVENRRRAEQAYCQKLKPDLLPQRNVISDREAGRPLTEDGNWGYHPEKRQRQDRIPKRHGVSEDDSSRRTGRADITYEVYISLFKRNELSFCTRHYPRNIMWLCVTFLLIIGSVIADHNNAWETGNEYHFIIRSRTLTVLDKLAGQFSGIFINGDVTVQVKSSDTLRAVVSNTQYAPVHKVLPEGWESEITDLEYQELSLSGKPFEIKLQNGVIRDVLIDQIVPTWEVNLLKSIVSQMHIDTQGENRMVFRDTQLADNSQPYGTFKIMEDSVGGKCEVLYNITPLPETVLSDKPELVPLPNLRKDGHHIDIIKTKNYSRCEQRMAYHSGIVGKMNWKPGSNDGPLSRSSTSRIVISGNLKRFTIQSSMTTNEIFISSKIDETYSGAVYSRVNLTLDRKSTIYNPMPVSNNLMSTGNLVYIYNSPFSDQRTPRRSSDIRSTLAARSERRSSTSSSEESHSDDDSSSSSSSNSNSEERDYLQPKPKLDEAPESPLLPYFVGYKGNSIQKFEEDFAAVAINLISWMTKKIESYGTSDFKMATQIQEELLEQYAILVRLMRTMNVRQITEVERKLSDTMARDSTAKTIEDKKLADQTMWDILYNTVAHVGTGPALITITNWVKNKKLEGMQAADIISRIPKATLTPTPEYVQAFFELITDEQVRKQKCLNTIAPLAFADLIRHIQSNKASSYYPVYSFGRMVPKNDRALLQTYIPYMAIQLKKAIEEGDNPRIQTYIMALGNFGHPKVLSIFEPYLEGSAPMSKFQRLMMVVSLNRLGENFPRLARSVAYKIYINTMEAYELRCAAVYVIMKTNPPLNLLQRMAEFTHQDQDKQVNSAVTTSIEGLANSKQPELQELANKARIASKQLKSSTYTENYSHSMLQEITVASLNMVQTTLLQTIGSDNSMTSKGVQFNVQQSFGGFNFPSGKVSYEISNIRELLDMWYHMPWMMQDNSEKKLIIKETIEKLGIKPDDPEQIEWNIFGDSLFAIHFYAFDNHTFEELANMFATYVKSFKSPRVFEARNFNYLYYYDMTMGFPTESGLPFVYTLTVPKFTKIGGGGSHITGSSSTGSFMEVTVAGHFVNSEKIQSRIGFVAPFEHRHYIAGIDVNLEMFVPAGLSISRPPEEKKFVFKMQPPEYNRYGTGHSFVQHSVVPYTARHNILSFKTDPNNDIRVVNTKEPHEAGFGQGNLIFTIESDHIEKEVSKKGGIEAAGEIVNVFRKGGAYYRKCLAMLHFPSSQVNITWDTYMMYDVNASSEATIPAIMDKQPESEERKEQFLKEVSKDVNASTSYVYDISVLNEGINYVFTLALANSRADNKYQSLLYWNAQDPRSREITEEFCALGHTKLSQKIPLNFNKAMKETPKYEFKTEMRVGNCTNGETMTLKGTWTRTDGAKERAMRSETVKKCQQEMKQGNIWLPICQNASKLIRQKDHLLVSLEMDSMHFYMLANSLILSIKAYVNKDLEIYASEGLTDKNTVDMDMKLLPNNDTIVSLRTSNLGITFPLTDIFEQKMDPSKVLNKLFDVEPEGSACVLDKTQVVTFDEKVYPVKLGNCWHVIMTTYPKRDPNNPGETLSIPKYMSTIVMAREMDDGSKQIRIIFGDQEIHLQKSGNRLEATFNEQVVLFTSSNSSHYESFRENTFEIYRIDDMIAIFSIEYEIYAVYDGERILLRPTYRYLSAVRGLCGNYDMRSGNDFIVPKNCILTKPEEFIATYALTQENCQGPALQNKRRAEQSTCIPRSNRPSDVISDIEAGRSGTRNRRWGYH